MSPKSATLEAMENMTSGPTIIFSAFRNIVDTGAMVASNTPPESALTRRAASSMASVSPETFTGLPPAWFSFHTSLPSMVRDSSFS